MAGAVVFLIGAVVNVTSDYRLAGLRRQQQGQYVIPRGGAFRFLSSPNLTGEIVEWIGFALMAWSLPGLAFAMWTAGAPTGSSGIRVGETVVFDGMEFVGISPGEFLMGSTSRHASPIAQPVTRVRISKGFYLGKYEVTQAEWQAVMGNNPSKFSGCGRCPVEMVSWEDVQVFIGKLNARSGGDDDRHLRGGCDGAVWQ